MCFLVPPRLAFGEWWGAIRTATPKLRGHVLIEGDRIMISLPSTIEGWALLIVIATLVGVVARWILNTKGGILSAIAVGFVGTFLGSWLFKILDIRALWVVKKIDVVAALVGAIILLLVLRLLGKVKY